VPVRCWCGAPGGSDWVGADREAIEHARDFAPAEREEFRRGRSAVHRSAVHITRVHTIGNDTTSIHTARIHTARIHTANIHTACIHSWALTPRAAPIGVHGRRRGSLGRGGNGGGNGFCSGSGHGSFGRWSRARLRWLVKLRGGCFERLVIESGGGLSRTRCCGASWARGGGFSSGSEGGRFWSRVRLHWFDGRRGG
jgi:hypothetical protein